MLGDVSPGHMAAGVPRRNPACLLGSNPQSSRSLGRLFWGAWTPAYVALFGLSMGQQVQPIPPPGLGRQGHG